LVRTTDWLAPWLSFDHQLWTRGLEYLPAAEAVLEPRLFSPLVALPQLSDHMLSALVYIRTALAFALLFGLVPRLSAFALFAVGYGLMALDRYRYFHHMHLLWTSCLWLALLPTVDLRAPRVPRWPLSLLRTQVLIIYLAAGLGKLQPSWLSGAALEAAARAGLLGGPIFTLARDLCGVRVLAGLLALAELGIALLLVFPRARLLGVALGVALHVSLEASMMVSTFGAQMVLYLMLFLPWDEQRTEPNSRSPTTT
jgi:hypothetical protein